MNYLNNFLKSEITCLPGLISKYLGDYYNNALCNGATWLFVLWWILHLTFDNLIETFLKRLRLKEYIRTRLTSYLWYLGFSCAVLLYCQAALFKNDVELFNFKRMHIPSASSLPSQVVVGYSLISTFYLHSAFYEGLRHGSLNTMFSYLFLAGFTILSYILRIVEISFTLTTLISISHIPLEVTKGIATLSKNDNSMETFFLTVLYVLSLSIFIAIYMFIIPLTFVVPLGIKILTDYPNWLLILMFLLNVMWLTTEMYNSVLFRLIYHWFYHTKEVQDLPCSTFKDCSLFDVRDDVSYNIQVLRNDMKEREEKMTSLKKPKSRNMLINTLKCMVAIKKKLNEKRMSESSDSDDSEKSESDQRSEECDSDEEVIEDKHEDEDGGEEEQKGFDNEKTSLLDTKEVNA